MTDNELRKLSRTELLEMLLELSNENEELKKKLSLAEEKLSEREIDIAACGSLAEASLALNGVFKAADAACEQMKDNMRARLLEIESRKLKHQIAAETIIAQAKYRAREIIDDAKRKAEEYERFIEERNRENEEEKNCGEDE